jgi:hypothetical protein
MMRFGGNKNSQKCNISMSEHSWLIVSQLWALKAGNTGIAAPSQHP